MSLNDLPVLASSDASLGVAQVQMCEDLFLCDKVLVLAIIAL
jgi:hypothetical protein